jgi:5'-nucleotidase
MVLGQKVSAHGATPLHQPVHGRFARNRQIFVNRNLRMDQIQAVGFDMDYTLAAYVKQNIEALSFRLTAERLVEKLGYPEELVNAQYDPQFVVRGLAVDKRLGNIFKMDRHGHVGRVYHGHQRLDKVTRRDLYRTDKIRLSAPRYHWLDTLFSLPEAALYSELIELYETQLRVPKVAYRKLFEDIRETIDECHRDGSLKSKISANLSQYIQFDPRLSETLHEFRASGKKLFLLTNSYWSYSNDVMRFLLDAKHPNYPRWQDYFDIIVVGADKPGFFTENRPFMKVNPLRPDEVPKERAHSLERGFAYQGGSLNQFEKMSAIRGDSVLYVGDHIFGDIIRSKKASLWRTALILEELEDEIRIGEGLAEEQREVLELEVQRRALDQELTVLRLRGAKANVSPNQSAIDAAEQDLKKLLRKRSELSTRIDRAYNPYWGSVFKEGAEVSRFGHQVEKFACLYTGRVSNFLYYAPDQFFTAPRHWMAHEKP